MKKIHLFLLMSLLLSILVLVFFFEKNKQELVNKEPENEIIQLTEDNYPSPTLIINKKKNKIILKMM